MLIVIGIDNGQEGAVAILDEHKKLELYDMPYKIEKVGKTKRKRYDIDEILSLIKKYVPPCHLCEDDKPYSTVSNDDKVYLFLERAHPMPRRAGGSPQGNFRTGFGSGLWQGICSAWKINYEEVSAKKWQEHFMPDIKGRKELKGESVRLAQDLFPDTSFKGKRGGDLDGRSDATLISLFGLKTLTNSLEKNLFEGQQIIDQIPPKKKTKNNKVKSEGTDE